MTFLPSHFARHQPELAAPSGWLEALARGEAQIAAGQVVSGDVIRSRIRAAIERMERRADLEDGSNVAPRR